MADWTNNPSSSAAPPAQNTDTNSKPWQDYIKGRLDDVNPPPKVFKQKATVEVTGPFDLIVGGSENPADNDPTPWELKGNKVVGQYDWNLWTRQYKKLLVQRFMLVTIRYYIWDGTLPAAPWREVLQQKFYIAQGGPNKYADAMVYIWKLASKKKKGVLLKVDPKVEIGVKDINLGSIGIEGLEIELVEGEEQKIDTPPPKDAKPPGEAQHGDPADKLKAESKASSPSDILRSLLANRGTLDLRSLRDERPAPTETYDDSTSDVHGRQSEALRDGGHWGTLLDPSEKDSIL